METKPFISDPFKFLKEEGNVVDYIRHYNWQDSAVGSPETWTESFRISFQLLMSAKFPMALFWGNDNVCFYNNPFASAINQSPNGQSAFGMLAITLFADSGQSVNTLLNEAKASGHASQSHQKLTDVFQTHFGPALIDYSFSHVPGPDDGVAGLLVSCSRQPAGASVDSRFQQLVDQASVGIMVLKAGNFSVEIVNEMFGKLTGKSKSDLLGQPFFQCMPDAEKMFRPPAEQVLRSQQPLYFFEHPFEVSSDGITNKGYANLTFQIYHSDASKENGVLILYQDVTEIVRNRKKIHDTETKARLAIESADLGSYEVTLATDEVITSDRFKSIWGVTANFSRREFAEMIHADDREIRARAYGEASRTGNIAYEVRIIRPDGQIRWVRINGRIIYDENRSPVTLLGVVQDITPLREFTDTLAAIVQERTLELQRVNEELVSTNEELSEANEALTNANKDLEQFAYVASHDLQEPLRKIILFSNLVHSRFSTELPTGVADYLSKIASAATRMSNLIRELLDYSKLSYKEPLFQKVDLNQIVASIIQDFEVAINQKNVRVTTEPLPVIEAIPIQMNQVIYNLIGNALKFTRKDIESTIHVSARKLEGDDVKVFPKLKPGKVYHQISVTDNGIGFRQQYAEKIFTIFHQLNNKSVYGGYGIGLSLCRRVIDNHKGIIFANGEENNGSTFTFIIPEVQTPKPQGHQLTTSPESLGLLEK